MAKRYYLAKLKGTGRPPVYDDDGNVLEPGDPIRTALHEVPGINLSLIQPGQNMETGAFLGSWCLVYVAGKNHGQLAVLPDVFALPDVSGHDIDWNTGVAAPARADAEARIVAAGFAKTWKQNARFGDVLDSVGRQIEPTFRKDNFDVAEPVQ